jgi:hypothetical protein
MTPLVWWIFWTGFWADLLTPEPPHTAEIVSFADWKRAHPPRTNGRAA